ncbi:unnamed protein product [Brugia timori]|uniref:Uncharacterized protein n=1 Tax=Brugia timori TaxID=42155 RepID=A0A0R3QME0_9BILA|nr:unnamed protein product [Brugia timori]
MEIVLYNWLHFTYLKCHITRDARQPTSHSRILI